MPKVGALSWTATIKPLRFFDETSRLSDGGAERADVLVQQDTGTVILRCVVFLDLGHSLLANVRINGVQGFFFFLFLLLLFFLLSFLCFKPSHLTGRFVRAAGGLVMNT